MKAQDLTFRGYKPPATDGDADRAAHALDWAGRKYPMEPIPENIIFRVIYKKRRTPSLNAKEVQVLSSRRQKIKMILRRDYGRGMVTVLGLGIRATVGTEDVLRTDMSAAIRRYIGAAKGVHDRLPLVNLTEVPKTERNKMLLAWFTGIALPHFKGLAKSDVLTKLLSPAFAEKKEEERRKKDDKKS